MKCKDVSNLLVAYQMQEVSAEERKLIEEHLKECETCQDELKNTITFLDTFDSVEEETPSIRLQQNFETFLHKEIEKESTKVIPLKEKNYWKKALQIAASITILIGSFYLGKNSNNTQISSQNIQQKEFLALLQDQSASKRIMAVSELEKSSIEDKSIIQALINKLFIEENINVRMAACEALVKFSSLEEVKNAFIKALETEKEPAIQIELIQILAEIQEKRALTPMKKLLENENTPYYVKQELNYSIASLN